MKAWVQEYSQTECKELYKKYYKANPKGMDAGITTGLVCAKNRRKQVDTCQGFDENSVRYFKFDLKSFHFQATPAQLYKFDPMTFISFMV